jgi:hypothetical protein
MGKRMAASALAFTNFAEANGESGMIVAIPVYQQVDLLGVAAPLPNP